MPVPPSYIQNIAIEIKASYQLNNTPYSIDGEVPEKPPFIGRVQHRAKLLEFLHSSLKKGVFLITGYRGMGKTSFVNSVLSEYHEKSYRVIPIHITLAQNKPKEIDILKLMVVSTHDQFTEMLNKEQSWISRLKTPVLKLVLFVLIAVSLIPLIILWKYETLKELEIYKKIDNWLKQIALTDLLSVVLISILSIIIVSIILFLVVRVWQMQLQESDSAEYRIKSLVEKCYASISEEAGNNEEINVEGIGTRILGRTEKKTKQFLIADSKEIEYALQQFLKKAKKDHRFLFIYIFDELDKVDPAISTSYLYDDLESFEQTNMESVYQRDLRDRKQAIINVIAGLKNFLTTAEARFIFIAGREMFDASLADISDRQSSISSIFTYVFNIESLLKEEGPFTTAPINSSSNTDNSSLSAAIEEYLKQLLFDQQTGISLFQMVKSYYPPEKFSKVYFVLQNFITYLTYRSNGSPKKIIRAIQEFIKVEPKGFSHENEKTMLVSQYNDNKRVITKCLYFNYHNQYRIGFINYLYLPYLIKFGRTFKLYSDNIIVSTPYLFDHLLKFHPFAFSLTNLELIPEVLSTNKTPSLRKHILQIIDHLGANHIRKTDIGLFDYKFYSRTLNEITFLSKVFEQESAAFNFTLDESYLVILHVRSKVKELRSIYSKFLGSSELATQQIYSIAHLNGMLGDLHFFNQEYDDAIVAYSDAIRPINHLDVATMNIRDFVTLIKNKLKLGLCFEKISSYEEALAFYSDSSQDAKRFMIYRIREAKDLNKRKHVNLFHQPKEPTAEVYQLSSLNDILQIIIQCFIAKMIIQEKMGAEGVTGKKLSIALGGFLNLLDFVTETSSRNHIMAANAFLLTGKLLYFKNMEGFAGENNYSNKLPVETLDKLNRLSVKFDFNIPPRQFTRKPSLALNMYLLGLAELMKSTENIVEKILKTGNILPLLKDVNLIFSANDQRYTELHFRNMASLLSCIGDCLLSMHFKDNVAYNGYDISELLQLPPKPTEGGSIFPFINALEERNGQSILPLAEILKCYYLSGRLFLKYGRSVSCSFQHRKILHLLKLILKNEPTTQYDTVKTREYLKFIKETIVQPVLEITSQNTSHTDTNMLNRATEDLGINQANALNNLSNHPESREAVLLFNYIRIKIGDVPHEKTIKPLINPANSFATQYSRLLELDFFGKYRSKKIDCKLTIKTYILWDQAECNEARDYLFSMLSIIRILKIYGTDYMLGFSYYAYTHYKIARFLKTTESHETKFHGIRKPLKDTLKVQLKTLLGKGGYSSLDASYHFMMAKDLYEKATQLHTGGTEYKKAISQMIYLEDDFNDNAYHFGAALDRYMMTNGVFNRLIEECAAELQDSAAFNADSYLGEEY